MKGDVIGLTKIGRTVYEVRVIVQGELTRRDLPNTRAYSLTGPRGATYYVRDHGPRYCPVSLAMGGSKVQRWNPAPRPLRGLEREHIVAFYDHPAHGVGVIV